MKYPYRFGTLVLGNGDELLTMELPEPISLVADFLFCDVQGCNDFFLKHINRVLRGEVPHQGCSGNVYELHISPEQTEIIDTLNDEDAVTSCKIETCELKEIVELWLAEQEKRKRK